MIIRRKLPCWIIVCDKCGGGGIAMGENTEDHFATKKEAMEVLDEYKICGTNKVYCDKCKVDE